MNFFIVDNGSIFTYEIASKLKLNGHNCTVQKYSPYNPIEPADADVIILSGGYQYEVGDVLEDNQLWFKHEFDLICNTNKPILGICLGHQMINVALGGSMLKLERPVQEVVSVSVNQQGQNLLGYTKIDVLEHHDYAVDDYSKTGLIELATSQSGTEILYHPERNFLGTQFHPEIFVNDTSEQLFFDLIGLIHRPKGLQS